MAKLFLHMITCSKTITFEAAHRILGHEGRCRFLHGHRYVCHFTFASKGLDELGRVIDFSMIKTVLWDWIKKNFDHNVILFEKDVELIRSVESCTNQTIYRLSANVTAENLALHLLHDICPTLFKEHEVTCIKVVVAETETSSACATL